VTGGSATLGFSRFWLDLSSSPAYAAFLSALAAGRDASAVRDACVA